MKKINLIKPSNIKDIFGAFLVEDAEFTTGEKYDMPIVGSNIDELPCSLFSYQKIGKKRISFPSKTALHFYIFDYLFDGEHGVWNALIRGTEFKTGFNLDKLKWFDYIIVPDYSLYGDLPIEWQIRNVYRSRVVAYALQKLGFKVIINARWSDERSYEFCFTGIKNGSIVAVGTHGCSKELADRYLFDRGLVELIKRVKPRNIIFYGSITNSVKTILKEFDQDYIVFKSDTAKSMEAYHNGNESE